MTDEVLNLFKLFRVQPTPHLPLVRQPGELELLTKRFPKNAHIVEIGSYAGGGTVEFAKVAERVYAVDPWMSGYDDGDIASRVNGELIERIFDITTRGYSNIVKFKTTSLQMATYSFPRLDVVYLDGNHKYEALVADIAAWWPKTKMLCGHDYTWEPVRKALGESGGKVVLVDKTNWILEKPDGRENTG